MRDLTGIFSMYAAGMYPVSPELQRVASHQCAPLRSSTRKHSPAGKRSAFRSAELKENRERYIALPTR